MTVVEEFNQMMGRCRTAFNVTCARMSPKLLKILYRFTREQGGRCHAVTADMDLEYVVMAIDKDNGRIASYIAFNTVEGEHNGQFVKAMIFDFSCTDRQYGRRGLSVLLRLLIITFAIRQGFTSVISSTNEASGPLLVNKFGFEKTKGDDVFLAELYVAEGALINTRLLLTPENLGKYRERYRELENCNLTK